MAGMVKRISKQRFDIFSIVKNPSPESWVQIEWYADKNEVVVGTIIWDSEDNDLNYVLMGRDEASVFRAIECESGFNSIIKARNALRTNIRRIVQSKQEVFTQVDPPPKKQDIFDPVVKKEKLHPSFVMLKNDEAFSSAKEVIQELMYNYRDLDGNFIEQFQTTGFNSRLWELYLNTYLLEENFLLDKSSNIPDFICQKFSQKIFIEAVTVNPSSNSLEESDPSEELDSESIEEIKELLNDYMPIRFGSPLFSKLRKEYWKHEHIKGHPIVFAIQDFHKQRSMIWSSTALPTYLYGTKHSWRYEEDGTLTIIPETVEKHIYGTKEIPSGFFNQPNAENISAILFSNSATISKFNRMGKLADFGSPRVSMIRAGMRHNHDPNAAYPIPFTIEVTPEKYSESWAEGLSMYHNPNALYPIDPDLFPSISHHFFEDGQIRSETFDLYIYNSFTSLIMRE